MATRAPTKIFSLAINAGVCRSDAGENSPVFLPAVHQQSPVNPTCTHQQEYKSQYMKPKILTQAGSPTHGNSRIIEN